jgi:hypothetical protein
MPESNEKPSFKNLRLRIADRARSGRNVVLTPNTALQVAAALGVAHQASLHDDFGFTVEQWTDDGVHIEEVMALCRNALLARAAFKAAVELRPQRVLYLRNGTRVLGKHEPERELPRRPAPDSPNPLAT